MSTAKIPHVSEEEENFLRMHLLMTGISSRAVRVLFDKEFSPVCLGATIKKETGKLIDLKNKRIINGAQWELLFPRTVEIEFEYMSYTCNFQFLKAVKRLGGLDMDEECKVLRSKHLDQSTVPWNIRVQIIQILDQWQKNDEYFVETRAAKHVLKCIQKNSCVTITASSGVGKTATLQHVVLKMAEEGYDVLLVTNPHNIIEFYNPNQKTLFVIDNFCGTYSINQSDLNNWEPVMMRIEGLIHKSLIKIIVACRIQVYKDNKFEALSIFKTNVCNLLSEDLCLSQAEKESIAEIYLETEASEIIQYSHLYECFPLLCKLYRDNTDSILQNFSGIHFQCMKQKLNSSRKKKFSNSQSMFISERFSFKREEDMEQFIIVVPPQYHQMYIQRMVDDWSNGRVMPVFNNKNIGKPDFRNRFLNFVETLDLSYQKQLAQTNDIEYKYNALLDCCFICDFSLIQWCCYHGADVNQCRFDGVSPVFVSSQEGDTKAVKLLLEYKADVNKCNKKEVSPLFIACQGDHVDIIKMLLEYKADVNKCKADEASPLFIACLKNHVQIVKILLEYKADVNRMVMLI
ncbi:Hypothetical predicted protein [Mytilus galloprovincialis]|uniref:Novel STAND NTPase 3 domain-containing protein n=1 Tax=Mytilus galloprovincialis TaxID=29158 RepID=A0A8B6BXG8_MYTGA|nr:Hypothetical predicted protein [Mytilus galloprovincialis]